MEGSAVLIVIYPWQFVWTLYGCSEILLYCRIFLVRLNQVVKIHFGKKAKLKGREVYKWTGTPGVDISCYLVGIFGRKRSR